MKPTYLVRFALALAGAFSVLHTAAQDTLRLTLPEAEKQFVEKNLQLMAEKYNIDIARAQVIQARLYNNPNISIVAAAWNQQNKKPLDVSNSTGQYEVDVQQLITLAGKRNKQIKLAQTNTQLAENRFFDLMRTLRFTLHSDFYQAYFLQNSISAYQVQIASLEKLTANYNELQAKGVITLKEVIRVKSLLYSLKSEQTALQNQFNDTEAEMQLLLQNNHAWFVPVFTTPPNAVPPMRQFSLPALVDSAYTNRSDLKAAQNTLLYSQQDYSLQKAMAVPDLTLGAQFDKRGSYIDNASFLTVAIDLPFFNRNQYKSSENSQRSK
jgi:outer membrane protein, heavy metal efflux system